MAKHHPDLIMCRKLTGIAVGRLCEKCDGKCVICDSYVSPCTLVRVCDECNYGTSQGRCVICGGAGISDAYYCRECTIQEKDRDGCPKIINLGLFSRFLFSLPLFLFLLLFFFSISSCSIFFSLLPLLFFQTTLNIIIRIFKNGFVL
jgi:PHD finger-like domain-containing protein 5A